MNAFIFTDRQNFNQKTPPPHKSIMPQQWNFLHKSFLFYLFGSNIFAVLNITPQGCSLWCMDKFRQGILCRKLFQIQNFKPVIAILADHLLVPSRTLCLIAFIWPAWLFSSTPNTALIACEIERKNIFKTLISINRIIIQSISIST